MGAKQSNARIINSNRDPTVDVYEEEGRLFTGESDELENDLRKAAQLSSNGQVPSNTDSLTPIQLHESGQFRAVEN